MRPGLPCAWAAHAAQPRLSLSWERAQALRAVQAPAGAGPDFWAAGAGRAIPRRWPTLRRRACPAARPSQPDAAQLRKPSRGTPPTAPWLHPPPGARARGPPPSCPPAPGPRAWPPAPPLTAAAATQMKAALILALAALAASLAAAQGAPQPLRCCGSSAGALAPALSRSWLAPERPGLAADCSSLGGSLASDCSGDIGTAADNMGLAGQGNSSLQSTADSSSISSTCCNSFQSFLGAVRPGRPPSSPGCAGHASTARAPSADSGAPACTELQVQHGHRVPHPGPGL